MRFVNVPFVWPCMSMRIKRSSMAGFVRLSV